MLTVRFHDIITTERTHEKIVICNISILRMVPPVNGLSILPLTIGQKECIYWTIRGKHLYHKWTRGKCMQVFLEGYKQEPLDSFIPKTCTQKIWTIQIKVCITLNNNLNVYICFLPCFHPSDFYMRVCLLIQSRVTKTKRTAVIRHTSNPVFNESFNFKLTQNQLDSASVSINAIQVYSATKGQLNTARLLLC